MPENEIFLQTPNERMSDLASDYAYLTNLKNKPLLTEDEFNQIMEKREEVGQQLIKMKEIYGKGTR